MREITSGLLDGACCYLSGPMEYAADHGVEWRRKFVDLVWQAGLNVDFIDPTNKPGGDDLKIGENKSVQIDLQQSGQFVQLRDYVAKYRRYDLRFVDYSDFLVTLIDPKVHMCGTYDEIFTAERQHKPNFFICEGGLKKLPRWLFDVVDIDDSMKGTKCNVFETIQDVVKALKSLDIGLVPMSSKWVLIRKYIEKARLLNPNKSKT